MAVIEFRYLMNHSLFLDGKPHDIPMKIVYKTVNAPHLHASESTAPFPEFDMNKVQTIDLGDTEPQIPARRKEWSDQFFARIQEAAFSAAITKRAEASAIAQRVAHYIRRGVIELVSDDSGVLADNGVSEAELNLVAGLKP